jgi:hypothetical protein
VNGAPCRAPLLCAPSHATHTHSSIDRILSPVLLSTFGQDDSRGSLNSFEIGRHSASCRNRAFSGDHYPSRLDATLHFWCGYPRTRGQRCRAAAMCSIAEARLAPILSATAGGAHEESRSVEAHAVTRLSQLPSCIRTRGRGLLSEAHSRCVMSDRTCCHLRDHGAALLLRRPPAHCRTHLNARSGREDTHDEERALVAQARRMH